VRQQNSLLSLTAIKVLGAEAGTQTYKLMREILSNCGLLLKVKWTLRDR
jgi:hypothetical protein